MNSTSCSRMHPWDGRLKCMRIIICSASAASASMESQSSRAAGAGGFPSLSIAPLSCFRATKQPFGPNWTSGSQHIRPTVAGEFDDFSLLRTFAEAGLGIFAAPAVLDRVMQRRYGFVRIGRIEDVRAHFYAISVERKVTNPAVVAICDSARQRIFAKHGA